MKMRLDLRRCLEKVKDSLMKNSGLGPLGTRALANAQTGKAPAHPLINAIQFNAHTQSFGGASMDVKSGEILNVGEADTVLIGGEKDTSNKRIPTTYYGKSRKDGAAKPADINPAQVMQERRRVKSLTGNRPGVVLGSYVSESEPHKGVQMDASAGISDRSKVIPTLVARNEEAGFDLKSGENVPNPYYQPRGRKK
jgi:hypothetical protein